MRSKTILGVAAGVALLVAGIAQAHVTVQPKEAPAGGFVKFDVRVPTERDDASTTKVDLQMPPGFAQASYQPMPGWSVNVVKTKLDKPIRTDDGEITEQVSRIVWTGTGKGLGRIAPGQFTEFPLSVQVPGKAGDTLTFKALQTYSDGEVVRWIGDESSDTPAPTVKVVAPAGGTAAASTPASTPARPADAKADDSDGNGLAIAALVVGILALIGAGAALAGQRRRAGAAA